MNYITMTKNPSTAFRSNAIIYDKFSTSLNSAFDETLPDEFGFGLVNKTQIWHEALSECTLRKSGKGGQHRAVSFIY